MLLEQHLLQLFGNLPYLSKAEITKHLEQFDLIKAFLVSENWDKAVECRRKNDDARKRKIESSLYMNSKTDRVEMTIYELCSGELEELIIDFPVESVLENSTEIVEYDEVKDEDRVICQSKNFEEFENQILTIFHKIRSWFDVDTRHIRLNLDHGFDLEFLKKLRFEKLDVFELSGDKKNHQIDGKELCDLLNTWNIECVRIKIETIGRFEGNSKMLKGTTCEFTDSRWITGDMLIDKLGSGTFKRCLLTSEDFNAYFKEWRNAGRYVGTLECHLEHELDVEKVLEGLEAKNWDPMERGRIFREYGARGCTYIDLADGMDISSHRNLATIHISADKKVIRFFYWFESFPLREDKNCLTAAINNLKPKLEQFDRSPRELAKIAKEVEDYEAKLQTVNEQIARENQ